MAYGLGMPAYLGRDVLVRVFYALGDGNTPFRFSVAGIGLNVMFDWLLVGGPTPWGPQSPFNFGAPGLVLATVAINTLTCLALVLVLQRRLQALPLAHWAADAARLTVAALLAGVVSWILSITVTWPADLIGRMVQVGCSGAVGVLVFGWLGSVLSVPEIDEIRAVLLRRFRAR